MRPFIQRLRGTRPARGAGTVRVLLGTLFLSTGAMKLLVPMLREAFSGQLRAAELPLHGLNMWLVPLTEMAIGVMLIVGFLSRPASAVALIMMLVATYVHLVVHDPALFPLQPERPVIPMITIVLCGYVLWKGGGSWSLDLASEPR